MADEDKPAEAKRPARRKAEGEICGQHWPDGWPERVDTASCIHGAWTR